MSLRGRLARMSKPATSNREALLDDLRARMRRVLERTTLVPSAPRVQPSVTAEDSEFRLPFFAEETPLGTLHRRVLRLSPAHRTGRAPAYASKDADCTLLSL